MRYLDSGARDPADALGSWFATEDVTEVVAMRFQAGFFGVDGLAPALPLLDKLKADDLHVGAVVGSNDANTLQIDLEMLIDILGIPRANAQAAVVSFSRGLFHPKVYHISRSDGSQAAYVGSANLTYSAVTSLNVEAGLIVDSREGDSEDVLSAISVSIDEWLTGKRDGVYLLNSAADIATLVAEGIVATAPTPRVSKSASVPGGVGTATKPALTPLLTIPRLKKPTPAAPTVPTTPASAAPVAPATPAAPPPAAPAATGPVPSATAPAAAPAPATSTPVTALPVVTQSPPYPGYVLFAPGTTAPTSGANALTGTPLPSAASGLILRLNRDSARRFAGRTGTTNISIPVPTLSSIRFGIFRKKYDRPRAEFEIVCRLVHATGQHVTAAVDTGIMVYGFAPKESGHGDVRLVMPAGPARDIRDFALGNGLRVPTNGDAFLLEWPTASTPQFKATFFDKSAAGFATTNTTLTTATASGNVVGQTACWLPAGFSPVW